MRTIFPLLALVLAAAPLAGCNSTKRLAEGLDTRQNAGQCPSTGSIYDASRYVKFKDGTDELFPNIEYTAEIVDVRSFCRYIDDKPLVAELEIDFAFGKGEAATDTSHAYPFFVAVTRRNGKVLAKEIYQTEAKFVNGTRLDGKTELVGRITIPRADETIAGSNFEILVGFDLDEQQLAFNRAGKRFLLGAGN